MALSFFTTARFKLRALKGSNKVSDIDAGFEALANDIDAILYAPGDLRLTARSVLDEGWLNCEGQAVSRTTFAALFAAIGTAYGAGNGTTTFNVPDYRERVPTGAGAAGRGLASAARGATGGTSTHTLTAAESGLPDHQHHLVAFNKGGEPPSTEEVGGRDVVRGDTTTGGAGHGLWLTYTGSFSFGVGVEGVVGGAKAAASAHTNLQPYQVCSVWIKT